MELEFELDLDLVQDLGITVLCNPSHSKASIMTKLATLWQWGKFVPTRPSFCPLLLSIIGHHPSIIP